MNLILHRILSFIIASDVLKKHVLFVSGRGQIVGGSGVDKSAELNFNRWAVIVWFCAEIEGCGSIWLINITDTRPKRFRALMYGSITHFYGSRDAENATRGQCPFLRIDNVNTGLGLAVS